jgi:hypothetical protein
MPRLIRSLLSTFALFSVIFVVGCKDESTGPAGDKGDVSAAYRELENQMYLMATTTINDPSDLNQISFVTANNLYRDATSSSPNNAGANFGAGLTEILRIYADPNINAMILRWDSVSLGKNSASSFLKFGIPSGMKDMAIPTKGLAKNMAKIVQTAITNPPLIGEMQDLMRDHLLPHIDYALDRFAVVESNPDFEFKISGKMQGDIHADSLFLDNTEVYIMDGVLRGIKAMVEQFLVYRFDLPAYTLQAAVQSLQPNNTSFFYRASDGVARSQSVLADITTMIGKFQGAINFLKSETDDQSDDIIKVAPAQASGVHAADLDTALVYLAKALNFLSTSQNVLLTDADIDGNDYNIQVNIANLYNNPPLNPKTAWFPAYSVDTSSTGDILWHWTNQTYSSFTFPDPTLSGLFPGMTNTDLKRILHIDEAFAWKVYVSLFDNMTSLPNSASAQLIINNTIYNPKKNTSYSSNYRDMTFYVMENDNQPVQLVAILNSVSVPLELSNPVNVDLGSSYSISANVTLAPQNITAAPYQNSGLIYLNLINYNYYEIQKAVGSGSFSVINGGSPNWYGSTYNDYDVAFTSGNTYHYRARIVPYTYYYSSNYAYAARANNFTNTATVTIP